MQIREHQIMRHHIQLRRFTLIFALAIALTIVFFARNSAAAPVYFVHGSTTAACDTIGATAQADYQDSYFGSELHGFWDSENVTISFQFPDGRQFSPFAAILLDGVVDLPPNYTTVYQADVAGDLYFDYPVTNKWPYGCYKFTATGDNSGQTATGYFVVTPHTGAGPAPSPAKLAVWNNGTFDASAVHDSLVNIHGVNFFPNEVISIWITQPDGTVLGYPQQVASDAGNFESTFQFTSAHQTGHYTFTALGTRSGYQIFAPFDLRANSSTPSGWAKLRVAFPYPASTAQNGSIAIGGTLFSPGEPVGIWMTLPNNAVRGLPTQLADGNGDFFIVVDLDERLPTGHYSITASGVYSGRLVISGFDVTEGEFQGTDASIPAADLPAAPQVVETNLGDGTLGGPTNLAGAQSNPGPEVTPPDAGSQGCGTPNALWTPNC
jgi:hypothetical protein